MDPVTSSDRETNQLHYKARMRAYEMFRALLRIGGSDAVLFGGFVRRTISGESLDCDLDIYSMDNIDADQVNMLCAALAMCCA